MAAYLFEKEYENLASSSETMDAALQSKDEAWDQVNALKDKIHALKGDLATSKKSGQEAQREFADKLVSSESAKQRALEDNKGLLEEIAKLKTANKNLVSELGEAKTKIIGLEKAHDQVAQDLFNLQGFYGDKKAKVVRLRATVREAKRRYGVDLWETSLNLVKEMYKADLDRDYSFLPKQYQTEIARMKCEAAGGTFVYPEDNEPEAADLETGEPDAEELDSESSESGEEIDDEAANP